MSGRVEASPRRACGRTRPWAVHRSWPLASGKPPWTRPGTTTTSHSRPLDLCAVSTLTVFSPPGRALSSPFSNSAAARRKPRNAWRVARPSSAVAVAAKEAAVSRKLPSVSRRRAASAPGDADSSTSRPVTARTRCSTSISGSDSDRRRSRSSAASRANRTRASAENGSPSWSPPRDGSTNVSRASAREITSAGSVPSTAATRRRSRSSSSGPPRATRRRARRPSRARSRGPIRQRGPVRSRTREALAPGSWSTSQVATRSATSGRSSRPARPTTSTGTSRVTRAACSGAKSAVRRHSTAISPGGVPVATRWAIESAIQSVSSTAVRSSAQRTRPSRSAPGAGRRASTPSCMSRNGAAMRLARSRRRPPLRRFSLSDRRVAGVPSACGKCSGKSSRLATEAPRQP